MFSEVAFSASSTDSTAYVWDIRSGSILFSFKQTTCNKGGLALVPRRAGGLQTGAILTAQTDRAVLNVYNWHRDQVQHKMLTPEKLVSVAASHQGTLVAGATAGGRLYLWQVATGLLLKVFDAHYRRINRIQFSGDDQTLLTASEDAAVNVWLVANLLEHDQDARPAPLYSWSDHTLAVTDIAVGHGALSSSRVFTSSLDHTVKLWDLGTGELLTTFLFPKPVSTLMVDPLETRLFAACDNVIYPVDLYRRRHDQAYGGDALESVGGMAKVEAIGIKSSSLTTVEEKQYPVFTGHSATITSMALSFDGQLCVSASEDGNCIVWDVLSRQPLRKFESHKGPVVSVHCLLRPLELQTGVNTQDFPPMSWKPFKRTIATEEEEDRTGFQQLVLDTQSDIKQHHQLLEAGPLYSTIPSSLEPIVTATSTARRIMTGDSNSALQAQVSTLQAELQRLHEHHQKFKELHNDMYNAVVDKFMVQRRKRTLEQANEEE